MRKDYKTELTNQLEDLVSFVSRPQVDQNTNDLDVMVAKCNHLINMSRGYHVPRNADRCEKPSLC